mgnify:FL=1|jgi:hypothetical protein
MAKDRLDGSPRKKILVELFLLPGRVILWLGYMFPEKGYKAIRQSARHARSPIMTYLWSTAFWGLLVASVYTGQLQQAAEWVQIQLSG